MHGAEHRQSPWSVSVRANGWSEWDGRGECVGVWMHDKMKITERSLQVHDIKSIVKRLNANDSACKLHHQIESTMCTAWHIWLAVYTIECLRHFECLANWCTIKRNRRHEWPWISMYRRPVSFVLEWKLKQEKKKHFAISGGCGGGGRGTHQVV